MYAYACDKFIRCEYEPLVYTLRQWLIVKLLMLTLLLIPDAILLNFK